MSPTPRTAVDGFEFEDRFLAWSNSHETRMANPRSTPLDLHLNEIIRQDSPVLNAFDRARALYNARIDTEFLQKWQQARGPEFMASEHSQGPSLGPQRPQSQREHCDLPQITREYVSPYGPFHLAGTLQSHYNIRNLRINDKEIGKIGLPKAEQNTPLRASNNENVQDNDSSLPIVEASHEVDTVSQVSQPRTAQPSHSIVDVSALGLSSTDRRDYELSALPSLTRDSSEHAQFPANDSDCQTTSERTELPKKILVDESEIDFDASESDEENVVQRSQKGTKKEGSEDVAKRSVGTDRRVKGEVRRLKYRSGRAFRDANNPHWGRGEYHYKIRSQLIEADNSRHVPYVVEPASGYGNTDVTSRCTDQKDWTVDPETIQDPRGGKLLSPDYLSTEFIERNPPDWILDDGTVVLDLNGHPVRRFNNIPSTLSSAIEAPRMEGLRALNGMRIHDLVARMPKYCETKHGSFEPLQRPSAFTNRARNWRDSLGIEPLKRGRPRKTLADGPTSDLVEDDMGTTVTVDLEVLAQQSAACAPGPL